MKQHIKYTLKTWLTAVFAAPVIIILFDLLHTTGWDDMGLVLFFGIVLGFLFSIPSALLFGLISHYSADNDRLTNTSRKVLLSVAGIALTALAFLLFNRTGRFNSDEVFYLTVYAGVITAGVWMYWLQPLDMEQQSINQYPEEPKQLWV